MLDIPLDRQPQFIMDAPLDDVLLGGFSGERFERFPFKANPLWVLRVP